MAEYLDYTGLSHFKDKLDDTYSKTDTKNTAGSTNNTSKLFLIGATSQAANPQTYSHSGVYEQNGTMYASGFTGNLNGDNYVQWGGNSLSGNVSPADAGCIDDFGHNKAAYWGGLIDVEYSTDGGTTWTDYGLTDDQKWNLVTLSVVNIYAGKQVATVTNGLLNNDNITNYRGRITLHTRNAQGSPKFYSALKKIVINFTTSGASNCKVKLYTRTIANYNNNVDTWTERGEFVVSGWSGWNSIPFTRTLGGAATQTGQDADLRIEFWGGGVPANTTSACCCALLNIRLIGVTNWTVDSFAQYGHIYSFDRNKNVTFPANVNSPKFVGGLACYPSVRPSSANTRYGDGLLRYYLATSSMTTGKPPSDAAILHFGWDNTGGYDSQVALSTTGNKMYYRTMQGGSTWNSWKTVATTDDIPTVPTIQASSTNGNISVGGSDITVYTHPTTEGNKHIPSGGSSGQVLVWSSSGTATWGSPSGDVAITNAEILAIVNGTSS